MSNSDAKPYAGAMLALFWLCLLAALVWGFSDYLDRRQQPESRDQGEYREVVLRSSRGGHYIAQGSINGKPVTFLVDTGATLVSVPAGLAAQLQLSPGRAGLAQTAGGTIKVNYTSLGSVRLGNIELRNVPASINPDMAGIDEVLLGMSFLRELELSHRHGELRLRQYY